MDALAVILSGIGMTLMLTLSAAAIGIVGGAALVLLSRSRSRALRALYSSFVHIVRGVPSLVWLFIAFFGLTQVGIVLDPVSSAILTLGIISIASIAEIYRGGLSSIRTGQWEASWALGLGRLHTMRDIVFPQVFRSVSPTIATFVIGLLKDSALASTIGVAEITFRAGQQTQLHGDGLTYFAFAGVLYLLLSLPLAGLSRTIHTRLSRRYAVV